MEGDGYLISVYVLYGLVSVGLTMWLARTLYQNGAVFLEDVFDNDLRMAVAVNKLLVTGFYMLNLGYAFLLLQANAADDALSAVEILVRKLGLLLVSLGVIHFANMYLFYRLRRRARLADLPPPVVPQATLTPAADGGTWGQPR